MNTNRSNRLEPTHGKLKMCRANAVVDARIDVPDLPPTQDLAMRVFASFRYHEDRQSFFEAAIRWSSFLVLLEGAAAGAGAASYPAAAVSACLAITMTAAGQYVFDFAGKAQMHRDLRKSFVRLLADVERCERDICELRLTMIRLFEGEPELFHAVNALAYNATQLAYGRNVRTLLVVSRWQRWTRHLFRYDPTLFRTAAEMAGDPAKPGRMNHLPR